MLEEQPSPSPVQLCWLGSRWPPLLSVRVLPPLPLSSLAKPGSSQLLPAAQTSHATPVPWSCSMFQLCLSPLQPFWPLGTGVARGFLAAFDAAWMVRRWAAGTPPLEVLAER